MRIGAIGEEVGQTGVLQRVGKVLREVIHINRARSESRDKPRL